MRLAILAACIAISAAVEVPAQTTDDETPFTIGPALLHEGGDYTLAARFNLLLGARRHDVSRAFPSSRYWRVEGKGALAIEADVNPDPLSVDVAGGIAISFAKPRVITFDPANVDAPGSAMEFDYGDLSLGAQGHVETNQPRSEARAAIGAELIYTHDHQRGAWPFIPSIFATVGAARPLVSDLRDSLGVPDDETYLRLEAGAAWHVSADRTWVPGPLKPVWLHAELAVYREDGGTTTTVAPGGPITIAPFDGTRVALSAAYRLLGADRGVIDEIFVRWTNGETPTLPAPRRAWMLGIVLAP